MVYALLYPENADIVGTFPSWEEAQRELVRFIGEHPQLRTEIGLRAYDEGLPAGEFIPADRALREPAPHA